MELQANCQYRIAYNADLKEIAGRPAVYLRHVWHCGCQWCLMDVYGRSGVARYLIKQGQVIPHTPWRH